MMTEIVPLTFYTRSASKHRISYSPSYPKTDSISTDKTRTQLPNVHLLHSFSLILEHFPFLLDDLLSIYQSPHPSLSFPPSFQLPRHVATTFSASLPLQPKNLRSTPKASDHEQFTKTSW